MKWRINQFRVKMGGDIQKPPYYYGNVPFVAQIVCKSKKIRDSNNYAYDECWICFVEGTPPANIIDSGVWVENYDGEFEEVNISVLFLNIHQHSIADLLTILNIKEAYIDARWISNSDQQIQIIAEISPPEIESSEPPNKALNVSVGPDNLIKIYFNKYIKPADNYDNISLSYLRHFGRPALVSITKTMNGNMLTINPNGIFSRGTKYVLNIPENSIKGQDYDITERYKISFTTMI